MANETRSQGNSETLKHAPGSPLEDDISSDLSAKDKPDGSQCSSPAVASADEDDDKPEPNVERKEASDVAESIDTEPSESGDDIEEMDWDDLQLRFHKMVEDQDQKEQAILEEFQELMNFFAVWSETSRTHEVDREFKRLKTRIFHVQNSEKELESRQQHYTEVVDAFRRALDLLVHTR